MENARRAAIHVLVEVEAQSVAASERRVILLQGFDGAAGAQLGYSFLHPHAHARGMALQSLGFGQQRDRGGNLLQAFAAGFLNGNDADEIDAH